MIEQGDIWWMEPPGGKRRPVLVVTRNEAIPVLNNVVVAPVTSTIRDIPTCIPLRTEDGLDRESVASFDNLAAVPRAVLTKRIGRLGPSELPRICEALAALADC